MTINLSKQIINGDLEFRKLQEYLKIELSIN